MQFLHLLSYHPQLTCFLLIPTVFILIFKSFSSKNTRNLPPSPLKIPIMGNLHQLSSLPHRSLLALSNIYGPLMLLKLGQKPTLIVSSSSLAREILKVQDHIFANRPLMNIPNSLLYQCKDIAFASNSEYWRQVKKVGVTHLLSNKRVQSYRSIREEEIAIMIEKIYKLSREGTNIINLTEILNSFAKDIISRVAVGKFLRDESNDVGKLIEEASVLLGGFHWGDYLPWLAWISKLNGLDTRIRESCEKGDEFLESVIERRSSNFDGEGEDGCDHSFVDVLLSLEKELEGSISFDKRSIKAIIMDMLGAGTDSTYISIEWVMAELLRNPNVMIKLKQEIKRIVGAKSKIAEENLAEMPYLKAIIKETFRLHPPAPILLPRESMQDTMIQGYNIPKHTRVLVNVWAIGRDPRVWSDAEKFMPERFMDSKVDFKGQNYELIPFGAGRRICPGIQFSNVIIELAVANIAHCFDWRLPEGLRAEEMDMAEAPGIASRKKINLNLAAIPC